MDPVRAQAFARHWIDAWNRHDLDTVVHHFTTDAEFTSPIAASITGDPSGTVRGRPALHACWTAAVKRIPDLRFTLDAVHAGVNCIAIHYTHQTGRRATEVLVLDDGQNITRGWGLYQTD
jgi:ketosteroid isomerase-like protein